MALETIVNLFWYSNLKIHVLWQEHGRITLVHLWYCNVVLELLSFCNISLKVASKNVATDLPEGNMFSIFLSNIPHPAPKFIVQQRGINIATSSILPTIFWLTHKTFHLTNKCHLPIAYVNMVG